MNTITVLRTNELVALIEKLLGDAPLGTSRHCVSTVALAEGLRVLQGNRQRLQELITEHRARRAAVDKRRAR